MLYLFFKVFFRLEIRNGHLVPKEGGVIIASNHTSYLDPPLIGVSIKRRPTFIAKSSLFKIPILGSIIKAYSIGVKKNSPTPSTIKKALKVLSSGGALVIFPEGGRSPDGNLREIKRGIGLIGALSNVPIVPAYIRGAHRALPVGARIPKFVKLSIIFGMPITRHTGETDEEYERRLTEEIYLSLKNLSQTVNSPPRR